MKHIPWLAVLLFVSCASQPSGDYYSYSFPERSHISDCIPAKSTDDMRDLLLTLPIFEISPEERREWVADQAKVTSKRVWIEGDGAQASLDLVRMEKPDQYSLKIGPEEDGSISTYLLRRLDSGWLVLRRSRS